MSYLWNNLISSAAETAKVSLWKGQILPPGSQLAILSIQYVYAQQELPEASLQDSPKFLPGEQTISQLLICEPH